MRMDDSRFVGYTSSLFDVDIRNLVGESLCVEEFRDELRGHSDWKPVLDVLDGLDVCATHLGSELSLGDVDLKEIRNSDMDTLTGDVVVDVRFDLSYRGRHVSVCYRDILATFDLSTCTIYEVNALAFITNSFAQFAQLDRLRSGQDVYLDVFNELFEKSNVSYVEWLADEFEYLFGDEFSELYDRLEEIHDRLGYFVLNH